MTSTLPKVFISYSHDTVEHQERVLGLADRLRVDGIDAEIDQYNASPPEGWPLWCERQIETADFVLMVCTETYRRRVKGDEQPGTDLGIVWEAGIIHQLLYDAGAVGDKFVPVLFSDSSPEQIPRPIKGSSWHVVDREDGYEDLYRRLTGQPGVSRSPLGPLRSLPTRPRKWLVQPALAANSLSSNGRSVIASSDRGVAIGGNATDAHTRYLRLFTGFKKEPYGDSAQNIILNWHARTTSNVDIFAWPVMEIKVYVFGEPPTRVDDVAFACDDHHPLAFTILDMPHLVARSHAVSFPRASENDKYLSFGEDFEITYVPDCDGGAAIDPFSEIDGLAEISTARLILIVVGEQLRSDDILSSFRNGIVLDLTSQNNTNKEHAAKSCRFVPQLTSKSYSFPSGRTHSAADMYMYKELIVGGEDIKQEEKDVRAFIPINRVEIAHADDIQIKSSRISLDMSGKDSLRDDGPSFCQRKASELFFGKALYRQPGWCIDVRHSG